MSTKKTIRLFEPALVNVAIKQSFVKLSPRIMIKNPVMFCVEIGTVIMLFVSAYSFTTTDQGSPAYNLAIFIILFFTLLFANFAEAIAEARGKAQADSLRKTREETPAKVWLDGKVVSKSSSSLKKGDIFICETGDLIPSDGEIIEGIATAPTPAAWRYSSVPNPDRSGTVVESVSLRRRRDRHWGLRLLAAESERGGVLLLSARRIDRVRAKVADPLRVLFLGWSSPHGALSLRDARKRASCAL